MFRLLMNVRRTYYINCESEIVNIIVFAGVTILLSQTVFRLLVGHVMIKTSDAVPILGRFHYDSQPCFLVGKTKITYLT